MGIRDTRMMERALRERWPIKPEFREKIMNALIAILADKNTSPREKTAAARALMHADAINLEAEKIVQADQHHGDRLDAERMDRIATVAQQLGLTRVVEAIATERSGSHPDAAIRQAIDARPSADS
jgi:hypothetical protein